MKKVQAVFKIELTKKVTVEIPDDDYISANTNNKCFIALRNQLYEEEKNGDLADKILYEGGYSLDHYEEI